MALQDETLNLLGEKESRSEKALTQRTQREIGDRVRERRFLEPVIPTHDHTVSNDFSGT